MGDYTKATDCFLKSAEIKKKLGNKRTLCNSYSNIGDVYYLTGDFKKSLDFYEQTYKMQMELGNRRGIANAVGAIGVYYQSLPDSECRKIKLSKTERLSKALEYNTKALKMNDEIGDKNGVCIDLNNVASVYLEMGQVAIA